VEAQPRRTTGVEQTPVIGYVLCQLGIGGKARLHNYCKCLLSLCSVHARLSNERAASFPETGFQGALTLLIGGNGVVRLCSLHDIAPEGNRTTLS
jgi:hypothetical protein